MNKGSKNLLLLGALATFIAILTTSISVWVYHESGDIYLDRSRPDFMPDEKEIEEENSTSKEDYILTNSGVLSGKVLDEYLENLDKIILEIQQISDPFSSEAISDETLDIPAE